MYPPRYPVHPSPRAWHTGPAHLPSPPDTSHDPAARGLEVGTDPESILATTPGAGHPETAIHSALTLPPGRLPARALNSRWRYQSLQCPASIRGRCRRRLLLIALADPP